MDITIIYRLLKRYRTTTLHNYLENPSQTQTIISTRVLHEKNLQQARASSGHGELINALVHSTFN